MADKEPEAPDELADSLNDLFTSLTSMVESELQGTNNILELLEKMNVRVAEEYKGFGDVASGLRVFVERLKNKSGNFDEYVQQIDAIEQQVTEFEAVVSVLDRYVSLLESKYSTIHCLEDGLNDSKFKKKDEDGRPSVLGSCHGRREVDED
ncbi:Bioproteinsis of lysosome-related organelles complex 1 subunit 2 [Hibiscus syriacus]|uniref:Bioproteinsis of lysosome-related organelles complex 1 subunit 2 n=1 Tax=Hibiscus syriacus TaxID=106335 RepID=A0A6A3AXS6_HIBSY|nr:Bioproteinsis of lysosome-related organelles complex 1 subunit 2 [Hibiscus syriacus]